MKARTAFHRPDHPLTAARMTENEIGVTRARMSLLRHPRLSRYGIPHIRYQNVGHGNMATSVS
jgi:hypothetical protein